MQHLLNDITTRTFWRNCSWNIHIYRRVLLKFLNKESRRKHYIGLSSHIICNIGDDSCYIWFIWYEYPESSGNLSSGNTNHSSKLRKNHRQTSCDHYLMDYDMVLSHDGPIVNVLIRNVCGRQDKGSKA